MCIVKSIFPGVFREVITVDIDSPRRGIEALLTSLDRGQQLDEVLDVLLAQRENISRVACGRD